MGEKLWGRYSINLESIYNPFNTLHYSINPYYVKPIDFKTFLQESQVQPIIHLTHIEFGYETVPSNARALLQRVKNLLSNYDVILN